MRSSLAPTLLLGLIATNLSAAEPVVAVGAGSFTTALPKGATAPQEKIYRTDNGRGPMPTTATQEIK